MITAINNTHFYFNRNVAEILPSKFSLEKIPIPFVTFRFFLLLIVFTTVENQRNKHTTSYFCQFEGIFYFII
jgi:hypothetical protein